MLLRKFGPLIAAFLSICTSSFGSAPVSKDPIRIQISGEPSSLDPARVVDQFGIGIMRNVVEGLFVLDENGALKNGIVESYFASSDLLTYRFKIRKDALWSDGRHVAVSDFVFALRHAVDPQTASPDADKFFAINNAREIYLKKLPLEALGAGEMNGELVLKLKAPDSTLLLDLSLPVAAPLRADVYSANHGIWQSRSPVTGIYQIESYKPSSQIRLKPNPYHSDPATRSIVYDILPEEITALNLFETGRLEVISSVTSSEIDRLKSLGLLQTAPSTTTFFLSFNVSRPPFNDLQYRRAVTASIDRQGLQRLLRGTFQAATSYLPAAVDGSLPYHVPVYPAAVERVRQAAKPTRITFCFSNSEANRLIAEKIQNDLKTTLHIEVSLEPMELKTLLARLTSDPPDMYLLGKSAIFNDPLNHLTAFTSTTESNFSRYINPTYDRLIEQIKQTSLGPARSLLAKKANELLVDDEVIVLPILLKMQIYGVSKSAHGFQVSPYQVINLGKLNTDP